MTGNPLINAFLGMLYITLVASVMYYGPKESGSVDGIVVPIAMLSLFVFSAAVMGYLLLFQPLSLFLENRRAEAVGFFLKTLFIFGCITVAFLASLFLLPAMLS